MKVMKLQTYNINLDLESNEDDLQMSGRSPEPHKMVLIYFFFDCLDFSNIYLITINQLILLLYVHCPIQVLRDFDGFISRFQGLQYKEPCPGTKKLQIGPNPPSRYSY